MNAWTVLVLLVFLSSGCVDTEERDSINEELVNATDDETKEQFKQLKEEFEVVSFGTNTLASIVDPSSCFVINAKS